MARPPRRVCWLEKRCSACGEQKPMAEYYPSPPAFDGRTAQCIACFASKFQGKAAAKPRYKTPQEIVVASQTFVPRIALKLSRRLFRHTWFDAEDLAQDAYVHLLEVLHHCDQHKGPAEGYATMVAANAMQQRIQSTQRYLVSGSAAFSRASQTLRQQLLDEPTHEQLADTLKVSMDELHAWRAKIRDVQAAVAPDPLEAPAHDGSDDSYECTDRALMVDPDAPASLLRAEQQRLLRNALLRLPHREAKAVRLTYLEGRPLSFVAHEFGLGQGHASRIIKAGVQMLQQVVSDPSGFVAERPPLHKTSSGHRKTSKVWALMAMWDGGWITRAQIISAVPMSESYLSRVFHHWRARFDPTIVECRYVQRTTQYRLNAHRASRTPLAAHEAA